MYSGQIVFSQLMELLSRHEFNTCVRRYDGEYGVRGFSCRDQFLCMAYAQLTFRESLRNIETCLRSHRPKLYHAGFRGRIARSTLADANRSRDWRIYADFAQVLIDRARRLYAADDFGLTLEQTVYALDSTTIDLCLSLFPWAPFRRRKAAVKLHTLIDLRGNIPTFVHVSSGKRHDVTVLERVAYRSGRVLCDGSWIFGLRSPESPASAVRLLHHAFEAEPGRRTPAVAKSQQDDRPAMRSNDRLARAFGFQEVSRTVASHQLCQPRARPTTGLLDEQLRPARIDCRQLYRSRWQVELFFRWIKQHLRIKAFLGNTDNAVKTQVWIALSVYLLVAILKKEANSPLSMGEILQILSVNTFEKTAVFPLLCPKNDVEPENPQPNQLQLFDF